MSKIGRWMNMKMGETAELQEESKTMKVVWLKEEGEKSTIEAYKDKWIILHLRDVYLLVFVCLYIFHLFRNQLNRQNLKPYLPY